jgi:hypothetical protein
LIASRPAFWYFAATSLGRVRATSTRNGGDSNGVL